MDRDILEENESRNLESIIRKEDPFAVCLQAVGLEGIIFLADHIDTDDPGFVDFYLDSRLVVSINKDHLILYQVRDANEFHNSL